MLTEEQFQKGGRPTKDPGKKRKRVVVILHPDTADSIRTTARIKACPMGYVIDDWFRERNSKPAQEERFPSHRPTPTPTPRGGGGGVRETQTRVVPDSQERRDVAPIQGPDPIIDPETGEVVFDV